MLIILDFEYETFTIDDIGNNTLMKINSHVSKEPVFVGSSSSPEDDADLQQPTVVAYCKLKKIPQYYNCFQSVFQYRWKATKGIHFPTVGTSLFL